MKISTMLDFNLQAYQERLGLVNFLDEQGYLAMCPPTELEKVANYLLYAEDVDAEVELKEGSKKKVSYEALIESALGESTIQKSEEISIYKVPRQCIDREKDKDIPYMQSLWECIDYITEHYQYCKDVLEGKRDMDINRKLIPTYQTKYFLREWMIDLRREQFLLKDSYNPPIGTALTFPFYVEKPDNIGIRVGKNIVCDYPLQVDFGNWKHLHAMLKYYGGMKAKTDGQPLHPWWDMYNLLDILIKKAKLTEEQQLILDAKIAHISNEDIVRELEKMGGKTYSVNYVSTIWKQHITKRMAKAAYLWYEEEKYRIGADPENIKRWKYCPQCRRMLYGHELNFSKTQTGEWKDTCKDCMNEIKHMREVRRKEKNAGKDITK